VGSSGRVSILESKAVDRWFIGGIMVSVLASKVVDSGLIGGVMVSILVSKAVDRGFIGGVKGYRSCLESGRSWVHRGELAFLCRKR
jgi:hypothetical protein